MWHRNRSGPSKVPCGTPESTVVKAEVILSTTSYMLRSLRELAIAGRFVEQVIMEHSVKCFPEVYDCHVNLFSFVRGS